MNQPIRPYSPALGPIPPRQAELLAFIDQRLRANGSKFPTVLEMREHMKWKNDTSVKDCLNWLIWRGEIKTRGERLDRKYERVVKETTP